MAGVRASRYRLYRKAVRVITKQNRPPPRYGFTLDHIVPVSYGFKKGIPPELIGSAENLEMLPFQQNIAKAAKITLKGKDLLIKWGFDCDVRE